MAGAAHPRGGLAALSQPLRRLDACTGNGTDGAVRPDPRSRLHDRGALSRQGPQLVTSREAAAGQGQGDGTSRLRVAHGPASWRGFLRHRQPRELCFTEVVARWKRTLEAQGEEHRIIRSSRDEIIGTTNPKARRDGPMNILFVIPIFNDWGSFRLLVEGIDEALQTYDCGVGILAVDDGSVTQFDPPEWTADAFGRVKQIEIVSLACNLGHQKAIAIGLSIASRREGVDAIVVMDGDGEDDPTDLPELLRAMRDGNAPIVLAHRAKRSEGSTFRVFYSLYKIAFRLLTGVGLSFGNYCVLSAPAAKRLTFMPNLWNSLPACCLRSKLAISVVSTVRGRRYHGDPKMGFVSLILHGLQAITVFSDTVLVRLALTSTAVAAGLVVGVVFVRLIDFDWLVRGWASNMVAFLVLSLLTVLFGLMTTSLLTLQERSNMPMIPHLHADMFVQDIRKLLR